MFVIVTKRLILQPFSPEDAGEFYTVTNNSKIKENLSFLGLGSCNFDDVEDLVRNYSNCDFYNNFFLEIYERDLGQIIGAIIAVKNSEKELDVSYLINSSYRNEGYATEALLGLANYFKEKCRFRFSKLHFEIDKYNFSAQKVLNKCGGRVVGKTSNSIIGAIRIR